ncbi:ABC transporter permease [Serpentinicella alkaliphila]|uniref:Putative ABC transport system permease protein n=1 Tax=Serpentinicella alkaliphila TaxID=1734049 RepID=A0A4R2TBM7_9FIRM|nr:iron export ABC transporter permease subunit FetB [Serpentinicella alkaliphila]QUH25594.1 iron export ABC transporter permease subunit FetB [Serpentinicella alkaliphila]TCP98374.1 putative ABC transport system permease protein [Serpentinicella alkaliphila]
MDNVIELQMFQVLSAYIFIALLLAIVRVRGIKRENEIVISTVRMTLQLILTGYILVYLFENPHFLFTLFVILLMEIFSIINIFKRVKAPLSIEIKKVIALSMIIGTLSSLFYFILVVIRVTPWYEPRYFIPIAGMIIGNSMTGIALGTNTLIDNIISQKNIVENALMLGATPKAATKQIVNSAFDAAILPTINSMVGMGIVFLPGMMTGQILSGVSPLTAIEYQIAIMLGILGSVALSVILFVQLGYRTFFNDDQQLIIK